MPGLESNRLALASPLCATGAALCVVHGLPSRNHGDDGFDHAEMRWSAEEDKAEDKL